MRTCLVLCTCASALLFACNAGHVQSSVSSTAILYFDSSGLDEETLTWTNNGTQRMSLDVSGRGYSIRNESDSVSSFKALCFEADADCLSVDFSISPHVYPSLSMELWTYQLSAANDNAWIMASDFYSYKRAVIMHDLPYCGVAQATGYSYCRRNGDNNLTSNTWNHLVAVWNAATGNASLYINENSEPITTSINPYDRDSHPSYFCLNTKPRYANYQWNGCLARFAIYGYALNSSEAQALLDPQDERTATQFQITTVDLIILLVIVTVNVIICVLNAYDCVKNRKLREEVAMSNSSGPEPLYYSDAQLFEDCAPWEQKDWGQRSKIQRLTFKLQYFAFLVEFIAFAFSWWELQEEYFKTICDEFDGAYPEDSYGGKYTYQYVIDCNNYSCECNGPYCERAAYGCNNKWLLFLFAIFYEWISQPTVGKITLRSDEELEQGVEPGKVCVFIELVFNLVISSTGIALRFCMLSPSSDAIAFSFGISAFLFTAVYTWWRYCFKKHRCYCCDCFVKIKGRLLPFFAFAFWVPLIMTIAEYGVDWNKFFRFDFFFNWDFRLKPITSISMINLTFRWSLGVIIKIYHG